jgi:hypothetical protein
MAVATNGLDVRGAFLEYIDPIDQPTAAQRRMTMPAASSLPLPVPPTSRPSPLNPRTSPTTACGASRWRKNTRSIMAIHRGMVAMTRAAIPVGTLRSARTTPPLPTRSKRIPTMEAARHCGHPGLSPSRSPRRIAQAYRAPPATRKRTAAMSSGGRVRTASRMARYVEPQMT